MVDNSQLLPWVVGFWSDSNQPLLAGELGVLTSRPQGINVYSRRLIGELFHSCFNKSFLKQSNSCLFTEPWPFFFSFTDHWGINVQKASLILFYLPKYKFLTTNTSYIILNKIKVCIESKTKNSLNDEKIKICAEWEFLHSRLRAKCYVMFFLSHRGNICSSGSIAQF